MTDKLHPNRCRVALTALAAAAVTLVGGCGAPDSPAAVAPAQQQVSQPPSTGPGQPASAQPGQSRSSTTPGSSPNSSQPSAEPARTPAAGKPTTGPTRTPAAGKPTTGPTRTPAAGKPTTGPTRTPAASKPTTGPTGKPASSPTPKPTTGPTGKPASSPTPKPTSPTRRPTRSPTPRPIPKPTIKEVSKPIMTSGSNGEQVRELQHRLLQLEWYSGRITGSYGDPTVTAVKGFQHKRSLGTTGSVDQTTWVTLISMTRTPTHDEKYNVLKPGKALYQKGSSGDKVKGLQARLKQLGWFAGNVTGSYGDITVNAVRGFQGRHEIPVTGAVDQRTWDRLAAMTHTPTPAELGNTPPTASSQAAGLDARCLTGRTICISKTDRKLVWMIDGKAQLTVDVRFGSEAGTPTRVGTFQVFRKVRNDWSRQYSSKMPFSMYFSGGEAVHYSSDFAARGYNGHSHGCVNVRDHQGVAWLFDQVKIGDKVVVYW